MSDGAYKRRGLYPILISDIDIIVFFGTYNRRGF